MVTGDSEKRVKEAAEIFYKKAIGSTERKVFEFVALCYTGESLAMALERVKEPI